MSSNPGINENSRLLGRDKVSPPSSSDYGGYGFPTGEGSSDDRKDAQILPFYSNNFNIFNSPFKGSNVISTSGIYGGIPDPSVNLPQMGGKRFSSMPDLFNKILNSDDKSTRAASPSDMCSGIPGMTPAKSSGDLQHALMEVQRRALYEELPMISMMGMQHNEAKLKREASSHSLAALSKINSSSSLNNLVNESAIKEVEDADEIIMTFPLIMAVFVAITSQFLIGYNTSVMNNPADVVFPGHSTTMWSLVVSAFAIGGPFGALWGGTLANRIGRRGAMLANTWIFLVGGLLLTLAPNISTLVVARLIIGFASGVSSVIVPVYLGEIAPPTLRGTLGTCTQFALVIGVLGSDVISFPFANANYWRYLFAVTPVLCSLQLLSSSLLLESPRWLLSHGGSVGQAEAKVVIQKFRGFRSESDLDREIEHFIFAANRHKTSHQSAHSKGAIADLLYSKELKVLVVSSIVLQMAQQLCGINAVFYYSTSFFQGRIDNPLLGTTLVALVNVIATYVALIIMDKTKRRHLLLISAGGMLISTILIIAALLEVLPNSVALFSVMAFVSFFELGLGPIPWLIVAEMFDSKYVPTAMSISCVVNWGCNFLVGFTFPFINSYLGPWSFAPFGAVLVLVCAFTYFYLPETYNKTTEDIQREVAPEEAMAYRIIACREL